MPRYGGPWRRCAPTRRALARSNPPPEGPLSAQGRALLDAGRPDEAVDVLRRAVAAAEPGAADLLARAYLDSGDWPGASSGSARSSRSGHVRFAGRLGVALAQVGDVDRAEEALRLALSTASALAANDFAILLRTGDRVRRGGAVLRHAADGGDPQAAANLVALYLRRRPARAAEAAERYADESRPDTIVALADVRAADEPRGRGRGRCTGAPIQLGALRAHTAYGSSCSRPAGDAAGAEGEFREGARHDEPGWPYTLGRFLVDDGRPEEAREFLEVAAGWATARRPPAGRDRRRGPGRRRHLTRPQPPRVALFVTGGNADSRSRERRLAARANGRLARRASARGPGGAAVVGRRVGRRPRGRRGRPHRRGRRPAHRAAARRGVGAAAAVNRAVAALPAASGWSPSSTPASPGPPARSTACARPPSPARACSGPLLRAPTAPQINPAAPAPPGAAAAPSRARPARSPTGPPAGRRRCVLLRRAAWTPWTATTPATRRRLTTRPPTRPRRPAEPRGLARPRRARGGRGRLTRCERQGSLDAAAPQSRCRLRRYVHDRCRAPARAPDGAGPPGLGPSVRGRARAARRRGRGAGRGQGHPAAAAHPLGPQAHAADRRACRSWPTCSPASARRACGGSCSARPTWPRPSPSTSATAPALGLEIEYVVEDQPLGTGGGIRNVAKHLTADDVLVFNGDVLCRHRPRAPSSTRTAATNADVTLHLVRVQDPRAFGCVPTDDDGRVTAFLEKTEDPPTDQINAGCYVFRRSVIESIPEGRPVSVERETFPGLLAAGARVSGHVDDAYWRDMGTPMDLVRGSADLVRGVAPSAALPGPTGESLVLEGAEIDPTARWCAAARRSGASVTIGEGARVEGAMLFDGAVVGDEARSCEHRWSGAGARIEEGAAGVRHRGRRPGGRRGALRAAPRHADLAGRRAAAARGAVLPRMSAARARQAPYASGGRPTPSTRRACSPRCAAAAATPPGTRRDGSARSGGPGPPRTARRRPGWPAAATAPSSCRRGGRARPGRSTACPPCWATATTRARSSPTTRWSPTRTGGCRGMRFCATRRVWDVLVPAVLEQKVTGTEARRSWRELCRRFGDPAPGPASRGHAACRPRRRRSGPCPTGSGTGRASTPPGAGRSWPARPSRTGWRAPCSWAARRAGSCCARVPGIGVWTAAEIAQRAWGDRDAVSVGDFHIPALVGWALLGRPIDDAGCCRCSPRTRRSGRGRCGTWSCRGSASRGSARGSPRATTARCDPPPRPSMTGPSGRGVER